MNKLGANTPPDPPDPSEDSYDVSRTIGFNYSNRYSIWITRKATGLRHGLNF